MEWIEIDMGKMEIGKVDDIEQYPQLICLPVSIFD